MERMMRTIRLMRPSLAPRAERTLPAMLLLVAALLWPHPGVAASETVHLEPAPLEDLPKADLDIEDDGIHLSLDDAVEIALRRNLGLVVERYNWIQAHEGVLQSLGIYDTLLSGSLSHNDSTQPTTQAFEGVPVTTSTQDRFSLDLSQLTPTGGLAELNWFGSKQNTNSQNAVLNPQYFSSLNGSFTQPLLRGFGKLATERQIMVARVSAARSRSDFEQQVAETIQAVDSAYWDLVEARDQLGVAQEALQLAQTLHKQNKVRVDVGTLAPLELIQSQAGIAGREEDIIRSEAAIGDAADHLRQLLNLEQGPLWSRPIVPTTDPKTTKIDVDVDDSIHTALAERPEIASEIHQIESLKIDAKYFRNQVLPQIDLILSYGLSGLAGTGPPLVDPDTGMEVGGANGNLGDALDQIQNRDFADWQVQLQFSYPIQNRDRRARSAIARSALDQGLTQLEQLKQQVVTEVRTAARQVETTAKQIDSARVSREARGAESRRRAQALRERHVVELPGAPDPGGPDPGAQPRGQRHHRLPASPRQLLPDHRAPHRAGRRGNRHGGSCVLRVRVRATEPTEPAEAGRDGTWRVRVRSTRGGRGGTRGASDDWSVRSSRPRRPSARSASGRPGGWCWWCCSS